MKTTLLKYSSLAEEETLVYPEEIKFFRSRDKGKTEYISYFDNIFNKKCYKNVDITLKFIQSSMTNSINEYYLS